MALRKRRHDVRVVTTRWKDDEEPDTHQEYVYRLPALHAPRNRFLLGFSIVPLAHSPANRRRMLEIVKEFKPDIIHQINHVFDTLFLSAYAAQRTGTPLVGSVTTPIQSGSLFLHTLMHIADVALLYNFGVRHWKRIICSDSTHTRYVLDSYGHRVQSRIVNNIYVGVHRRISDQHPTERASWPQIVTVGHVHEARDPTNIVRSMPAILKRFPDARFDIAGRIQSNRALDETMRLGLGSSVRFLGEVPPARVTGLVSQAQVFVILHQCRYAGLSFTAIEAMQFGTPVVINAPEDLYGPGMLKDGQNIVLVDANDVKEIADKIILLLENRRLREHIGQNGRQFVDAYLRWDINAQKTEDLYVEVLDRGRVSQH